MGLIAGRRTKILCAMQHGQNDNNNNKSDKIEFQFSSVTQSSPTLCDPMDHSTLGLPVYHQLPEFTQVHVRRVSDAIQPSHPLSSPSPPAPNPSQHQVFSNESALHIRQPKYWSFNFSISPSNEHPGLTSFRMDWLDLLVVQGTIKSLLQHHSSKASVRFSCTFSQLCFLIGYYKILNVVPCAIQ